MAGLYTKDNKGNIRELRSAKAAKEAGIDNMGDFLFDNLISGMEELCSTTEEDLKKEAAKKQMNELYPLGFKPYNDVWRYEPVDTKYFAKKFLEFSLTEKQQEILDVICGKDPFQFTDQRYEEVDAMWGKRSGKDTTISIALGYQAYKLCCMFFPWEFIGVGKGSSLDIVNVASNAEQAQNIFFKYLCNYVKMTKDPDTGLNWFSSKNFWFDVGHRTFKYMDLREKEGAIKKKSIEFGRGINCYSLTSERFTAEGLNIILAVMDEVGAMRPEKVFGNDEKMVGQYDSLSATVRSTSANNMGKMVLISYKYGRNCPMSMLVKRHMSDKKKFVRKYSVYEVRTDRKEEDLRSQFASEYSKDPEKAAMMYECKDPKSDTDALYSNIYPIRAAIDAGNKFSINPVKNKLITIDNIQAGVDRILEPWFRGDDEFYHAVHLDLAKGRVWAKGDCSAICMGHLQEMRLNYDKVWAEVYQREYGVDLRELEGQLRYGVVVDLMLQVVCKPEDKEIRLSDIRHFIIDLCHKRGFNIFKVTIDGWQSLETIQEFNAKGIEAELLSVDKTPQPHHTLKDFIQMGLFKTYDHPIWMREMRDLIDDGGKIDHPELSPLRYEEEGYDHGSKDVADSSAGMTFTLAQEVEEGGGELFFS